jgi:hypothetical protein
MVEQIITTSNTQPNTSVRVEITAGTSARTPRPTSMLGLLVRAVALPIIKTLDKYCGRWQNLDLRTPPHTRHLWHLADTGTKALQALSNPNKDLLTLWADTVNELNDDKKILALNTFMNLLAEDYTQPSHSERHHATRSLLKSLPKTVQRSVLVQNKNLSNNLLFHSGHLLLNILSSRWQYQVIRHLPNSLKAAALNCLKEGLFEGGTLKHFLTPKPQEMKSDHKIHKVDTTRSATQSLPQPQPQPQPQPPLSCAEFEKFSSELWTLAADFLDAARCHEPDPAQAMTPHQPNISVPAAQRIARMREAIKKHLPLFERVLSQKNFEQVFDTLCKKSELPTSMAAALKNKHPKVGTPEDNIFGIARNIISNLSPILAKEDKIALINELPESQIACLVDDMNTLLGSIDPYTELPFYRDFSDRLTASIKIKPVRLVAEKITKHYFQALKNYPEFQRTISVAIMRLGPHASLGERVGAIAQAAGLGFQKSMQLFSNDIRDVELREALGVMKQDVTPMSQQKVVNIILSELDALNKDSSTPYIFKLERTEDINPVLKSATVGQVHPALITVTNLSAPEDEPTRTRKIRVALKVKRDGLAERCHQEQDGLRIALNNALTACDQDKSGNPAQRAAFADAVKLTIAELFTNIRREIDFKHTEYENAKIAKVLYQGEADVVQLKSAACLAATDNLIIQEWAPGESIDTYWSQMTERAKTEDNFSERLRFAKEVNLALRLELKTWVRAFINGDPEIGHYLDGDRHDGNGHYDPNSQTYTLLDFGAGQRLTPSEARTLNKLTAAISARSETATLHYLLKLMPKSAKEKLNREDKIELKAQIRRHLRRPDDIARLNDMQTHLTDAGIWPDTLDLRTFSEHLDRLGLRDVLLRGSAQNFMPTALAQKQKQRRSLAMIQVLKACGVQGYQGGNFNKWQQATIGRAANNEYKVLFTGITMSSRVLHQLTDDYHELFMVKTLARLSECFVDAGLPAPGLVLQLNRGAKMIADKIENNNKRIAALHADRPHHSFSARDRRSLKKLQPTDVGNIFLSALRPNTLQFMRYQLQARLAPAWRADWR